MLQGVIAIKLLYREPQTEEFIEYVKQCDADGRPAIIIIEGNFGTGKSSFVYQEEIRKGIGRPVVVNAMNYSVTTVLEGIKKIPRIANVKPSLSGISAKKIIKYIDYIAKTRGIKRKFVVFNNAEVFHEKNLSRSRNTMITIEKILDLIDNTYIFTFITRDRKYVLHHIGNVDYKVIRMPKYTLEQMYDIVSYHLQKRNLRYDSDVVDMILSVADSYNSLSAAINIIDTLAAYVEREGNNIKITTKIARNFAWCAVPFNYMDRIYGADSATISVLYVALRVLERHLAAPQKLIVTNYPNIVTEIPLFGREELSVTQRYTRLRALHRAGFFKYAEELNVDGAKTNIAIYYPARPVLHYIKAYMNARFPQEVKENYISQIISTKR